MLALICGIIGWFGAVDNDAIAQDTVVRPIAVDSGRVLRLNRILIIGNRRTHDKIIVRELTVRSGDSISVRQLDETLLRDKNKIYNLRLFNTVSLRALEMPGNQFDLLIDVTERWYTFPAPIFEFSDRNFNEWYQNYNHDFRRINYGLRLYQYNFRGRNETLSFTAQFGFTRRFDLNYRIPYIDKKQKQGLVFSFDFSEPKNLAYFTNDHKFVFLEGRTTLRTTFGMGVSYNYRKSFYTTHSLQLGYRRTSVTDTILVLNPNYFPNAEKSLHYKGLTYSFNSDHRDVILYPLRGYQFSFSVAKVGLGMGDNIDMAEFNIAHARHWDLGRKFYLSDYTAGYLNTKRNQPYALYSALGYRRQLIRGYEIYVIEGPAYFINKTTLKKRIFYRSWNIERFSPLRQFSYLPVAIYIKTYLDLGYVENYPRYQSLDINKRLSNTLLAGTGAGLDLVTAYDLVFRFEYSFTREGTHGFFFNVKKEF